MDIILVVALNRKDVKSINKNLTKTNDRMTTQSSFEFSELCIELKRVGV